MTTPTSPWPGNDGSTEPVAPSDGDTQAIASAPETQAIRSAPETQAIGSEPEPHNTAAESSLTLPEEPRPDPTIWAHDPVQPEAQAEAPVAPAPVVPEAPVPSGPEAAAPPDPTAWSEPAPLEPRRGPYAPAIVLGLLGLLMAAALLLVTMGGVRINLVRSAPWVMLGAGALLVGVGVLSRARH